MNVQDINVLFICVIIISGFVYINFIFLRKVE